MTDTFAAPTGGVSEWLAAVDAHAAPARPRADTQAVHRMLPGYETTPLTEAPTLAAAVGLKRLWVKDESSRLGLPSFKILGASYALYRTLRDRLGDDSTWTSFADWERAADAVRPLTLFTATEGNHGRAVARLARLLGLQAHVLVPAGMAPARRVAIENEGASVETIDGTYDDAVVALASFADERSTDTRFLVLSDTAWAGYEQIPRWVIAGYGTIFTEVAAQLDHRGEAPPSLVVVQAGVGAFATAAVQNRQPKSDGSLQRVLVVEPRDAACVLTALEHPEPTRLTGPFESVMAGLNCGMASSVALTDLARGIAGVVTVDDTYARAALRVMHRNGFAAGPTGAAGVAALLALRDSGADVRVALDLESIEDALVVCTEGVTDAATTAAILAEAAA